jgi:hypothetical protein
MSKSTTSLAELPENITMQVQQPYQHTGSSTQQQIPLQMQGNVSAHPQHNYKQSDDDMGQNTYVPMNIHPNPYGNSSQPPGGVPLPEPSPQRRPPYQLENAGGSDQIHQYTLPSRDIPMNTLDYQQDETVRPNHVPRVKLTSDYIREYEAASEKALMDHEQTKYRETAAQDWFSQLQVPIFVAVLYFIFQMPIMNSLLRKYFSFVTIYHEDGNFNFTGLLLKSAMFGSFFYSMQTVAHKLSMI